MGQHDPSFGLPAIGAEDTVRFETRELAWELMQGRIDSCRIRFLIETGADVHAALSLAQLTPPQAMKNPQLRPSLARYLDAAHSGAR